MQSPVPASGLAELTPAARPFMGCACVGSGWGPRAYVVCCWCLLLPECYCCCINDNCFFSSRLVTFCTGMTVLLILFRLQLARDSRHTVGLGTSTNKSCLVIVFYAVKTYDWSIDTKEAGRGLFCIAFASAGRTCAALSCRKPSGKNSKKAILLARYAGQPKSSCGPWWLDHT